METIEIIAIVLSLFFGWDKVEDQIEQRAAMLEDVVDEKERQLLDTISNLQMSQTRFDDRLALFRENITDLESAYESRGMSQSRYVELVGKQIAILSAEAKHLADNYAQLDQAFAQKLINHAYRTEQLRTDLNASESIEAPFSDKAARRFSSQEVALVAQRNEISSQNALIEELRQARARLEGELDKAHKQVESTTESLSQLSKDYRAAKAEQEELVKDKREVEIQSQKRGAEVASLKEQKVDLEEWRNVLGGGTVFGTLLSALLGVSEILCVSSFSKITLTLAPQ